jgi:putative endonuclease
MKEYFYKDSKGQTQQYLYCCRSCPEPYKREQLDIDIFEINDNLFICKKCKILLGLNKKPEEFKYKFKADSKDKDESSLVRTISEQVAEAIPGILKEEEIEEETPIIIQSPKPQKDMFYAYAIKCSDNTFYFGTTMNVKSAIKNHNGGSGSTYTKSRRPVVLVAYKEAVDMEQAKVMKTLLEKEYSK